MVFECKCPFCTTGHLTYGEQWAAKGIELEPSPSSSLIPEAPEYMFDEFLKLTEAVIKQGGKKTIHAEANIFNTDVMFMYPASTRIYIKDMPEPKYHWYKVEKKDELE